MKRFLTLAFLALAGIGSSYGACPLTRNVELRDTLPELADFYFGDRHFDSAILLATNSRVGEGFPFISDANNLRKVDKVCIPEITEANRLRARYDTYMKAIFDMALPEPWETMPRLMEFPPDKEIVVASWIRAAQIPGFQDGAGKWITAAPADLWVTLEPGLKRFCTAFTTGHGKDQDQLTLRLEQRLGLPPSSNKTKFVRIRLARPEQSVIFRPCMYPATASTKCPVGPPPPDVPDSHRNWIFGQYYSSYGQSRMTSFPWTSLGYTFDWGPAAHADADTDFQKYGESEFVIRKGAPIEIVETVDTVAYCQ